jgi:hypothetical protein
MPPVDKEDIEVAGSENLETPDIETELPDTEGLEDETPEKPEPSTPKELAGLRRELEAERKHTKELLRELSETQRYYERPAPKAEEEPAVEDDQGEFADLLATEEVKDEPDLDPDKFIDELTSKGASALDKVLAKHGAKSGYVRKEEVVQLAAEVAKRIVSTERGKITIDARLVSEAAELKEFGDLNDERSPLFRETQKLYREAVALDPKQGKRPSAVLLALRAAGANLRVGAKGRRREQPEADEERTQRIRSQQGETGRGRKVDPETDNEMGPEAKRVVDLFGAFGVTGEKYRAMQRRRT